jgi:6-phosphogluconolactonase (cycloisomerase 2 family)
MNIFRGIAAAIALAACVSAAASDSQFSRFHTGPRAVYTETNAAAGNEILVLRREHDGDLHLVSRVSTRGRGTDAGLGNQGALALRRDGRRLYAVNAGSNDISVFAASPWGLAFIERVSSGGAQPISLTLHEDILYVLNAGDANQGIAANITGFQIGDDRRLEPLADSTRPLSTAAPGPAQIQFHPWGDTLVVTEKDTNKIVLFDVEDGVASTPFVRASNGQTPFGFAFDKRGHLIVSEAFGGAANASALSSYDLDGATMPLDVISGSVPTLQTAACWVVVSKDGRFAYTTNTGSGTISGYRVSRTGELRLLDANGVTANTGGAGSSPLDLAISGDGRFVFSLNTGVGTIASFRLRADGRLINVSTQHGIPASASGLAAH